MRNSQGPAAATGAWVRADRRRRWKALVVVALLAAITAGLTAAALAGARRTNTAFARLRAQTHAPDAIVFPSQSGVFHPDWSKLAGQPEVAQLTRWYLAFGSVPGDTEETVLFGSIGNDWGTVTDKPVVKQGRMYDLRSPDEMVVDEQTAQQYHIKVGAVFPFHAYGPKQDDTSGAPPTGAHIDLKVVGIVRTTPQFLFTPLVMLAPAVLDAHRNDILWIENAFVHLRPKAGGVTALQRDANRFLASGTPVLDLHQAQRRVNTTLNVEQSALLLLAVAIAAAGLVLVGQVLGRSASSIGRDAPPLRSIGLTKRELALAGARAHLFVAIGAAAGSIATAVVASRWFPVGLAARVDPSRGLHADWVVLVPVALAVFALVLVSSYAIASRAARSEGLRPAGAPISAVRWIRRNAPVSIGVGATMAFDRRARRRDAAVQPAIIGAVVGVLGVVGAFTIDHGLHDALSHPERAGVTWDATVAPVAGEYASRSLNPSLFAATKAVPGVHDVADVDRILIDVNGLGTPGFTVRPGPGDAATPITFTTMSGRKPLGRDEVAIGPATARDLRVNVGDVVTVGPHHLPMKVVGRALFPSDVHATFDQGVWLANAGWDAVVPPNRPTSGPVPSASGTESIVAIRFDRGVGNAQGIERVTKALGARASEVGGVAVPIELTNLKNVERLPQVLAVFLALLATAALGYVLFAIARARAHDFAILRALGFTRVQSRTVVGAQSAAVAVVGLLVGVPLGVLLGRLAWRLITTRVPLQDVPPVAAIALVFVVPGALVAAVVVAAWPARRVARLRTSDILRSE